MKKTDTIILHLPCERIPRYLPAGGSFTDPGQVGITAEFPPCEQFSHHGSVLSATVAGTPLEEFGKLLAVLLGGRRP